MPSKFQAGFRVRMRLILTELTGGLRFVKGFCHTAYVQTARVLNILVVVII